jgi:hypothetical protein
MKLFSLLKNIQFQPRWSYTTHGVLWRILLSESGFIVGEDRDIDQKSVAFFCIHGNTGKVNWSDLSFGENWWIGIDALVKDRLYLHGFINPSLPDHRKIIAVDLPSGRELWRNEDYALLYARPDQIIAYRDLFEKRIFYELDPRSGNLLGEFAEEPENSPRYRQEQCGSSNLIVGAPFDPKTTDDPAMHNHYLKFCSDGRLRGLVEFARTGSTTVISFHRMKSPASESAPEILENHLLIVDDMRSSIIYQDILNAETPAAVPGSFFIESSNLFYIKEKNTIVSIDLSGTL